MKPVEIMKIDNDSIYKDATLMLAYVIHLSEDRV